MLGQSPFAPLDTATSTTISLCLCSYQTNETCTLETPSHTGTSFTTRDIPNHRLLDQCATWRPPVQWFSSQEPQRAWSLHPPAVSGVDSPSTSDNVARQFKPQSGGKYLMLLLLEE
ncbi:hypothetical protein GT037_003921 [Alternaria burnsii]|uniref:Uncharacterized protein n=1 Tax=Alternaria burnsii TaxID=1187904 RepID=A0A8H7BAQ9_9PLEO|nr:uncharacterized protein GT037_003921 [Alternaria burnsii]KAF7678540.1 hypothetical protein GT037_003921 [Alternaria burnsii]